MNVVKLVTLALGAVLVAAGLGALRPPVAGQYSMLFDSRIEALACFDC